MKNFLLVLLGVVIGIGGFYVVPRIFNSNVVKPDSPTDISMMFKQTVDANSLFDVRALMTPEAKSDFTSNDLQAIRKYIEVGTKAEGATSYDNYEVITFGNKKVVTLWLVPPPLGKKNGMWQIQKIIKGNAVGTSSSQK